ncbi:MAG TPA: hypothetical protein VHD87_07670, partial [Acidimicrobiales bacterium]|nr:hypothetical protein [Acidimicrobiales bacterium]
MVMGPIASGDAVVIVPTRAHESGPMSPTHACRWTDPSGKFTAAVVRAEATVSRRSEITCTSST